MFDNHLCHLRSAEFVAFEEFIVYFVQCRPSIADQVRVGYFSQDRSAQTEVSEIAQLKEMTEVLQNLVRVSATC